MSSDEEREQLRTEVARLRAGESDEPVHEGTELTPGQWIRRWNDETTEERLQRVTHIRTAFRAWRECEERDHQGQLEHLRDRDALHDAVERVRVLARRLLASDLPDAQADGRLILQALDGGK